MTTAFSEYLFLVQFGPAVLNSVPVLAIDLHDPSMNIIFASYLSEAMFGYARNELKGKPLDILLIPRQREIHHLHFARYQKEPKDRTMNDGVYIDAMRKDGTIFKAQISLTVQPVGKQDCVIACIADVTRTFEHLSHPAIALARQAIGMPP